MNELPQGPYRLLIKELDGGLVGANMWEIDKGIGYTYYDEETSGVTFSYYNKVTTGQNDTEMGIPKTTAEMIRKYCK